MFPDETMAMTFTRLTDDDIYLFNEGRHFRLYERLGAHPVKEQQAAGYSFGVWAPNARSVAVIGDFNGWSPAKSQFLHPRASSGIWEGVFPEIGPGERYKFLIESREGGYRVEKADPFGFAHEEPPKTASITTDLSFSWSDESWMKSRGARMSLDAPVSVYELHLGSWARMPEEGHRSLRYRELAGPLVEYVKKLGYTHVEFMPVTEHPFYGSWGYQVTGFFAPTARYGSPTDFMYLMDYLHRHDVGVIIDWVPGHFPTDEHGLAYFDGTHLFEHADPKQGFHPDWNTLIFNYDRHEVRSFLTSSAMFWLDRYHVDGLRVDGVASMLYLDYSREEGEWIPNQYGGRENLGAIELLRSTNQAAYEAFPDVQTIAEESTAWPMVSRPVYLGGLGFGMKWDMGWMHDTLEYVKRDPIYRGYHQNELTFRALYAFTENYVLPLSHDEVVHGKGSLWARMPGDDWQKAANLRLLLSYMWGLPGKKLLFMGGDFGQTREWEHDTSVAWHEAEQPLHRGIQLLVTRLNELYRAEAALHELDCDAAGFEWLHTDDVHHSVLSFCRKARGDRERIIVVLNLTPEVRRNYHVGVEEEGIYAELLNSDADTYGGSGIGNLGQVEAVPVPFHGRPMSLNLTLPPLGVLYLKRVAREL